MNRPFLRSIALFFLLPALVLAATTQSGDTLQTLATRYGMTVAQFATLNPNLIVRSGQTINTGSQTPVLPPPAPPPPPPAPSPVPPVVPTPPPLIGGLQLGAFNAKVGTIQAYFVGWKDSPVCAQGQTTFLYWENYGYSLDSIISGSQDSVIQAFAARVCPNTILSIFHEMNGNWDSWDGTVGSNSSSKVIAAYQHIHDVVGSKVKYAWVVNNSDVPDQIGNRPANYYPGDAYVDIIGVDGFDWNGQTTFMQAISPNFNVIKTYGKPYWVTSFGTQHNQAAWITDAINQAKTLGIGALIYFSYDDGIAFHFTSSGLTAFHL